MGIPLTLSSVPPVTPYTQYIATNGQTVFPYPFPITQDSDLVAVTNGATLPTDQGYTLSGQGNPTGGNLTFTVGRTAGDIITLFRDIAIERITQFSQNSGFSSTAFNAEFNNIYLILQQLEDSLSFSLQIPNTNSPVAATTLFPASYAGKYLSFDSHGNPTPAVLTSSGTLTAQIIAGLTTPQTPFESAAGVTPVNLVYAPGCVDRYATNVTPGTTSMHSAFQAAINQARVGGGDVTYGATAPYRLDVGALDCTAPGSAPTPGITIRQIGTPEFNSPPSVDAGILVVHNDYTVFDFTGQFVYNIYDMTLTTSASVYPMTCFLLARNSTRSSLIPRFFNTKIGGKFSTGLLYNYGVETGVYSANWWENNATDAGAKVVVLTANNNVLPGNNAANSNIGFVSNFTTIFSGSVSTTDHEFLGGQFVMPAASTTSDLFYFDAVNHFKLDPAYMSMTGGRSYFYNDLTNSPSNYIKILNVYGDSGASPSYGVLTPNSAGTPTVWVLENIFWAVSTSSFAAAGSTPVIDNLRIVNLHENVTRGINIPGTMQNSEISYPGNITLGTALHATLRGTKANMTIGGSTDTIIYDTGTGGITITGALVATGTVTANNVLSVGSMSMFGQPTFAQITGWGTPVGGAVQNNFTAGAGQTMAVISAAVAKIITDLKTLGIYVA